MHCDVHCSVHCACTVRALCKTRCLRPYIFISRTLQFCFWRRAGTFYISALRKTHSSDLQFLPTCGANAAMLLLCLWVAALKMKVCLDWGFGTCKREFVQACVCTSISEKKQICCVFVWWVAALKLRVCLDWGFGKCKRELVQDCICTSISQKIFPGFFKKNSHPPTCCHITSDPPAPPWSMSLPNACRHPNRNGCFFWRPFEAKRCNNIELGERGHASFFAMSLTGWLFFLKDLVLPAQEAVECARTRTHARENGRENARQNVR